MSGKMPEDEASMTLEGDGRKDCTLPVWSRSLERQPTTTQNPTNATLERAEKECSFSIE
jgi:hypothetical protein